MSIYVIAYDVGTTGLKSCLFKISNKSGIQLVEGELQDYPLFVLENGGVEQNPENWWEAMIVTTKKLLRSSNLSAESIKGISFCAQMQAVVLVDASGEPVRNAMSYMDNRAHAQIKKGLGTGVTIMGMNALKLMKSLKITGAVSASVKDPVWKYNWVKEEEPQVYQRIHKWLDVKDFLVCKATGKFVMSNDSAFSTLLYDTKKQVFSSEICKMMGVDMKHLPAICKSTDIVGGITDKAAMELGLLPGTPVFSGGGDASLIGVGAGAVSEGDTHIYMGTSGWVSTVVKKQQLDISSMIASIVGADNKSYNYFAELETAGKCLDWARDHIVSDEFNILSDKNYTKSDAESRKKIVYNNIMEGIKDVPSGSNGVIFTPWLHGNRCPFEDPHARGMFINIGIETTAAEMVHAVIEGVCFHLKWQLETIKKKVLTSEVIRFVGGGALSPLTCQILCNVLGTKIETVDNPQNAGSVGAAAVMAVGLGIIKDIKEVKYIISPSEKYFPDDEKSNFYNKIYPVFCNLYKSNKNNFKILNNK